MNNQQQNWDKDPAKGKVGEEEKFIEDSERKYSEEARGVASVNVKNASASGDGALERSDESLPNNANQDNAQID